MTRSSTSPHPRKGSVKSPSRRHSAGAEQQLLSNGRPTLHPAGVVNMAVQGIPPLDPLVQSTSAVDLIDKAPPRGVLGSSANSLSSQGASRDIDGFTGTSSQDEDPTGRSDDQVSIVQAAPTDEQNPLELSDLFASMADVTRQVQELTETIELHRRDSQSAIESLRGDVLYNTERTRENTKNEVMQLAERINAVSHLLAKERSVREASTTGVEKQIRGFCEKFEDNYRQDVVKLGERLSKVTAEKEASEIGISSDIMSRLGDIEERCASLETRVLDKKLASFANIGDPWIAGDRPEGDNLPSRIVSMEAMARSLREHRCEQQTSEPTVYCDSLVTSAVPTAMNSPLSPSLSSRIFAAVPRVIRSRAQSVERGHHSPLNSVPNSVAAPPGSAVATLSERGHHSPLNSVPNSIAAPPGTAVASLSALAGTGSAVASVSAPPHIAAPPSVSVTAPSSLSVMMTAPSAFPSSRSQDLGYVHSPTVPFRRSPVSMQSPAEASVDVGVVTIARQATLPDGFKVVDADISRPTTEAEGETAPLRALLSQQGLSRVVSPSPSYRSMSPPEQRSVMGGLLSSGPLLSSSPTTHRLQMRQMPRTPGLTLSSSVQALPSAFLQNSSMAAAKQSTMLS